MNNYKVSMSQINKMKHCIGFTNDKVKGRKYRKYEYYRNYYTTDDINEELNDLVTQGLMNRKEYKMGCGNNPTLYYMTDEGITFLSDITDVEIIERQ